MNHLNYRADDYFSNYSGALEPPFYQNDSAFNPGDEELLSYDRTLTFVITYANTGAAATANAVLFGAFAATAQPALVTVAVSESSHAFVRNETAANGYLIVGMRFVVTNATNLSNAWTIQKQRATGGLVSGVYNPNNLRSPANPNTLIVEDMGFKLTIDGASTITMPITAGTSTTETNTLSLFVKSRTNLGGIVDGKGVREQTNAPIPVGNIGQAVALQLLRGKR